MKGTPETRLAAKYSVSARSRSYFWNEISPAARADQRHADQRAQAPPPEIRQ